MWIKAHLKTVPKKCTFSLCATLAKNYATLLCSLFCSGSQNCFYYQPIAAFTLTITKSLHEFNTLSSVIANDVMFTLRSISLDNTYCLEGNSISRHLSCHLTAVFQLSNADTFTDRQINAP